MIESRAGLGLVVRPTEFGAGHAEPFCHPDQNIAGVTLVGHAISLTPSYHQLNLDDAWTDAYYPDVVAR